MEIFLILFFPIFVFFFLLSDDHPLADEPSGKAGCASRLQPGVRWHAGRSSPTLPGLQTPITQRSGARFRRGLLLKAVYFCTAR